MNILIVGLPYHDYSQRIAEEFRLLGHSVTVRDIVPRTLTFKALRVASLRLWQAALNRHHQSLIEQEQRKNYDRILFIHVKQVSMENMEKFRSSFKDAHFSLYYWDAAKNHDYTQHIPFFEDVFTFDPDDARRFGVHYLPLFCSREFQGLTRREQDRKAVYFVGNVVTPRRYNALAEFRAYARDHATPFHEFAASTPPARIALRKAGLTPENLKSGSIAQADFMSMIERSVATFDYANHEQSGYTMRVIENLCAGKKIITNNHRVLHEAFYSPDRFHVFNELDFAGVKDFLDQPLADPENEFPEYRIQTFAQHLLNGTGHALPNCAS